MVHGWNLEGMQFGYTVMLEKIERTDGNSFLKLLIRNFMKMADDGGG